MLPMRPQIAARLVLVEVEGPGCAHPLLLQQLL